MLKKEKILDEKSFLSDTLSTQVRYVTLGVLGIVWGFFVGNTDFARIFVGAHHRGLVVLLALSIATLFVDYLQYLSGYADNARLIRDMEAKNIAETSYDKTHWLYRMRGYCFWIKQALLFGNIIGLLLLLGSAL